MMNNNKILTVSYGTFSCTLEGFDDSFGTMKAIAEYFRDLAADDRYFGAEPPQPDADMLARIAQKEVSRRVEAREQDGKIVLSALEDDTATLSKGDAPVAETLAVAAAATAPDLLIDSASDRDTDTDTVETEEIDESVEEDMVTADDAALHAAATAIANDDAEEQTQEIEEEVSESIEAAFVEDVNDIVPGQPDAEVEAFFAGSPTQTDTEDEEVQETIAPVVSAETLDPEAEPQTPDSIAAKLQRIRAVVAQHEGAEPQERYLEDEHAEGKAAPKIDVDPSDLIADARADIEDALEADEMADAEAIAEEVEEDADDVSAILSRLEAEATPAEEAAPQSLLDADPDEAEESEDRSVEDTISNLFDENEETLAEVEEEFAEEKPSLRKTPKVTVSEELVADHDEEDEVQAPRARVIKVKRADLEAALQKGDLEEYGDEDDADFAQAEDEVSEEDQPRGLDDLAPARSKETALSPEDQAELARELAELEEDISTGGQEEDAAPKANLSRSASDARSVLPSIDAGNEADVNRLLAETDHQMDEPESATRRDAFAHLRAAVAAKKADVAAGATPEDEESDYAYRNDLAEVVRPRRPVSSAARTDRPGDARPAPLKLVAEQRIDVDKPRADGPVRPRRISATAEVPVESADGESFAEFAAEMGATTLPQLLEAAAAYMSFVEGREQFSRPQLMTKVRQAGGEDGFTREESLRSFGQLLRTGKIEKIKAGRFTVSEDIGYRPDHRAAG